MANNATNSTEEDVLANYSLFFAAREINSIVPYIFCALATIGNTLSFIIMTSKKMRKNSSCIYLAAMAIFDSIVVYAATLQTAGSNFNVAELTNNWGCKSIGFLQAFAGHSSVLIIVTVTIERYIAIALPFKAKNLCTPKRAAVVVACLTIFSAGLNLPVFWIAISKSSGQFRQCARDFYNHSTLITAYSWVDITFYAFGPSIMLCVLNVLIIVYFRRSKKIQKRITTQKRDSTSFQLTVMLLTISAVFLSCMVPNGVLYIANSSGVFAPTPYDKSNYALYIFINQVFTIFLYFNHSCNFILYCLAGQRFRNELCNLFKCRKSTETSLLTPKSSKYSCNRLAVSTSDMSTATTVATQTTNEPYPQGVFAVSMELTP